MGRGIKRRFADDFKEEAVARLSDEGANGKSVADELGLTMPQLKSGHLELDWLRKSGEPSDTLRSGGLHGSKTLYGRV